MTFGNAPYGQQPLAAPPDVFDPPLPPTAPRRLLLLSPLEFDRAELSASSQDPLWPVSNLQTMSPRKIWRATSTAEWVSVAFATGIAANALVLVGGNFGPSLYVRVRAAATAEDVEAAPAFDTGFVSPWAGGVKPDAPSWPSWLQLLAFDNETAWRFWKVDIIDVSAGAVQMQLGRIILGRCFQPSASFDLEGYPLGFSIPDVQTRTAWGHSFTGRRAASAPRTAALTLSGRTKREILDGIAELQRLRGLWGDFAVCMDPGAIDDFHRLSMQAVFTNAAPNIAYSDAYDADGHCFTAALELLEVL